MVLRYDTIRTDFASGITRSGRRYVGKIARIGVQQYDSGPEYRSPEEVAASVASFEGVPLRIGHAPGKTVGFVRAPRMVGNHIEADLEITDDATCARVDLKNLVELSAGYSCELDPTRGVAPDGTQYRARQTNIRGDHVALLGVGEARCGVTCSVTARADSQVQEQADREQARRDAAAAQARRESNSMTCPCPRTDALTARRDALRSTNPSLSDWECDAILARTDAMAQEERTRHDAVMRLDATYRRDAARSMANCNFSDADADEYLRAYGLPAWVIAQAQAPRADANLEARIDSAARDAGVSRRDVADHLAMNHPTHRGVVPSEDDIANAVHSVKLRGHFTGGRS